MSSPCRWQTLEWSTSDEGWSWVKHSVSDKTMREFCGSRIAFWSHRTSSFTARSWMGLCSRYSIHPRSNKMYQDLKKNFWWTRMKREITRYVLECDMCWRVKADHLRQARNLQPLAFPSGSGKTSTWTSSWVCLAPRVGITRYGSLWTAWPSRLTLYLYPPPTRSDNMPSSTCHTHCPLPWYPKDHYLWQRVYLCGMILGTTT
jgi:hypothetical protein